MPARFAIDTDRQKRPPPRFPHRLVSQRVKNLNIFIVKQQNQALRPSRKTLKSPNCCLTILSTYFNCFKSPQTHATPTFPSLKV